MIHKQGEVQEDLQTIRRLEQEYRHRPQRLRIGALRLLKEDSSRTLAGMAGLLGISRRHLSRWWNQYRRQGMEGVWQMKQMGGRKPVRIGKERLGELQERLRQSGFLSLKEVQAYIEKRFGVR